MNEFVKVMKALSDPNRVKILKMLQNRVMCVCEIKTALGVAQPTASKHLKILENAGLIVYNKDGCVFRRIPPPEYDGKRHPNMIHSATRI